MAQALDVIGQDGDPDPTDYVPIADGSMFSLNGDDAAGYGGELHAYVHRAYQESGWAGDLDPGIHPDPAVGGEPCHVYAVPYADMIVGNMDGVDFDIDKPAVHTFWIHNLEGFTGPVGNADGRADLLGTVSSGIASSAANTPTDDQVTAMLLTMQAPDYVSF